MVLAKPSISMDADSAYILARKQQLKTFQALVPVDATHLIGAAG
jgi:hypothetical protein